MTCLLLWSWGSSAQSLSWSADLFRSCRTARPLIRSLLVLVPSSHHSLPRCPTTLFLLSSYKPRFLLCQVRIVHRQLWHFPCPLFIHCHPTSSPGLLVLPDCLVSFSHLLFHDPHCTGLFCITARYLLPCVFHVYVFVNAPSPRTILLCFSTILCLPLHLLTRNNSASIYLRWCVRRI